MKTKLLKEKDEKVVPLSDMERAWKYLNSHGIYTMEQFKEECKKVKINIGVFVTPLKHK